MKKITETEYYKKWYAQIEESELKKIDFERVLREYHKLTEALEKNEVTFEEKAILFARCIHNYQLKSPSQAIYPDFSEFNVGQIDADTWEISGYCDAPNSYGALTRDNFNVCIQYADEEFKYFVPKSKIHNTMIGVAVVFGFIAVGVLFPILAIL